MTTVAPIQQYGNARPVIKTAVKPVAKTGATVVIGLLFIRWSAGILENFGMAMLSEIAALAMLGALALLLLQRMRIAADVRLFCIGIVAWIISGAISFVANPDTDLQATIALLSLLLLYGLFANAAATYLRGSTSLLLISRFVTLFIAVGFVLSLLQILSGTGFVEAGNFRTQRAFGSDVHPVSFAIQVLTAMVVLEIARLKQRAKFTLIHIALLVFGAVARYLTYARTAWVMALMICAAIIILQGPLWQRLLKSALACVFATVFLTFSDRFADLSSLPMFLENFSIHDVSFDWRYIDNSVSWRVVNWSYGLQQALEQPWLGFGPGQSTVSSYFNLEMHNIFLKVFFEGGLFGLTALVLTLGGLVRLHRSIPNILPSDRRAALLANSFGLSLLLAVTFSTSFVDQLVSFLLYILLISTAASRGPTPKPQLRIPAENIAKNTGLIYGPNIRA